LSQQPLGFAVKPHPQFLILCVGQLCLNRFRQRTVGIKNQALNDPPAALCRIDGLDPLGKNGQQLRRQLPFKRLMVAPLLNVRVQPAHKAGRENVKSLAQARPSVHIHGCGIAVELDAGVLILQPIALPPTSLPDKLQVQIPYLG